MRLSKPFKNKIFADTNFLAKGLNFILVSNLKLMIRKTLLLFILISANIVGQNNSASPYSSAGLGESNFNGTQATRHMGGLDVLTDSIHANLLNLLAMHF